MSELKRYDIKYIRDYLKKDYKSKGSCYICRGTDNLELHHLYCVSELFHAWRTKNNIPEVTTVDKILELRVVFAKDCATELDNENLYTLCKTHHSRLHNLYGKSYSVGVVAKVKNWIEIQKEKNGN